MRNGEKERKRERVISTCSFRSGGKREGIREIMRTGERERERGRGRGREVFEHVLLGVGERERE